MCPRILKESRIYLESSVFQINRKLLDEIQAQEDKVNHINKVKAKLESTLDEIEDSLEREKRNRQDVEKQKRKVEGELKVGVF